MLVYEMEMRECATWQLNDLLMEAQKTYID